MLAPRGVARIAGGVLLEGMGVFVRMSPKPTLIKSAYVSVRRAPGAENQFELVLNEPGRPRSTHRLPNPRGAGCSVAAFVARGGDIAFTLPPEDDAASLARLKRLGLVKVSNRGGAAWVAREFFSLSSFLMEVDLDTKVQPFPSSARASLKQTIKVNSELDWDSYFNTDRATQYQFALFPKGKFDYFGVPLRMYWAYTSASPSFGSEAQITGAEIFALPSAMGLQQDALDLYALAAVLKTIKSTIGSAQFSAIVSSSLCPRSK